MDLPRGTDEVPTLPRPNGRGWLKATRDAWARWWRSPMAHEWDASDYYQLVSIAVLLDDWLRGDLDSLKELRHWMQHYGLTPKSRRTLRWAMPDTGDERGPDEARRAEAAGRSRQRGDDPRRLRPIEGGRT
ncbi:hypothetical protein [Euzebya rosea]|uniref:phage terminase small subunit n=1 Tax=Euzebya rosea TaxID=2052804 RepID=UPI0013002B86|nr:hypothetical protein [Euzebya rosea]